jgi:rhodanese-related sulfurtransferase
MPIINTDEAKAAAREIVPNEDADTTRDLVNSGQAILIDVRELQELQRSGKAKGAVHVPLGDIEARLTDDPAGIHPDLTKDKIVILHCAGGGRSAVAGKEMLDRGYTDVRNLGGFSNWVNAGHEIEEV